MKASDELRKLASDQCDRVIELMNDRATLTRIADRMSHEIKILLDQSAANDKAATDLEAHRHDQ